MKVCMLGVSIFSSTYPGFKNRVPVKKGYPKPRLPENLNIRKPEYSKTYNFQKNIV